jgi:Cu2+-exporting ATPase
MNWLTSLRAAAREVIRNLDQAADRTVERFHATVTLPLADAAGRLDVALEISGQDLKGELTDLVSVVDSRYQEFMVRRVDPLYGRARNAQLAEMGGFDISPQERVLNRRIAYSVIALAVTAGGSLFWPATLAITAPASFLLVLPVYGMAVRSVKQQRRVTYHVISSIAVTGIWVTGRFVPYLAALVFFYLGEKLLLITEDRSRKGIISVFAQQPRTAWRLRDGREAEVPFETILPGDVIVVGAGGLMPVDGTVLEGHASIDQQMLTGEAQPAEKAPGDAVLASTVVLAGKLHVRVDKAGTETVAAKIGEVLNRTASYQLALQSRGSKIAHDAALPTLLISGVGLVTLGGESALALINSAFGVTVRISGPIAMLNLLNIAAQHAILLKDGRSLELLSSVDTVLFDKTGTLTISQPHVVAVHRSGGLDEDRLLTLAAAAEHRQTHPIALAILAEAEARGLALPDIANAHYEIGYGIKVELSGQTIHVGSDRYMRLSRIDVPAAILERREASHAAGHSFIMLAIDGALAGAIELRPTVRPETEAVVRALRKRGLKMMIISGDQDEPTRRLADQLGLDGYFANVLPEGKAGLVERLQAEGRSVCFVGDGINDSIALRRANVSVSLRGATTVATDVAQVVFMQESIQQLPYLFEMSETMDQSLQAAYYAGMIPGGINVAGVFLLGWGYYVALGLNVLSAMAALAIGMYPTWKHKQSLLQQKALPGGGPPDGNALLPAAPLDAAPPDAARPPGAYLNGGSRPVPALPGLVPVR